MAFAKFRKLPPSLYYLFAGTMITRMGAFVFPYLTIYLSEAREYGFGTVGTILSVGSLGLLAGNFAGGMLTDKWSRKWTLISALLLNAAGFAGLAFHYDFAGFYALFLFVGYFGSGMYTPAANTLIADLTSISTRPFAYTVNYVCINLGMGLGPLLGGVLASVSYKWIFIGDVLTSLLCASLIACGIADSKRRPSNPIQRADRPNSSNRNVWWQHRTVILFCLSYFFLIGPLMGLEYAVPLLIKKEFEASLIYVGVIYSINAGCILVFSFLIERLVRGRNELLMMIVSGLLWTAGMSVLLFGFSVAALMVCTAIWTIGEIIGSILVPSFIAKRVPLDFKGRFMALNDIVRSLAGVVCPIGLGLIWTQHSASAVVLAITMMPVIGTICYGTLWWSATTQRNSTAQSVQLEPPQ